MQWCLGIARVMGPCGKQNLEIPEEGEERWSNHLTCNKKLLVIGKKSSFL